MDFIALKNFFFSKIFLFLTLLFFNVLNIIDKTTTYFGMQKGFIELNNKSVQFMAKYGVLFNAIFKIFLVLSCSILIYIGIRKLSEKIKYINPITSLLSSFLIGFYFVAVVNNIGWLI